MAKPRVGWIGTGVIGGSCARRLLEAQYPLVVTTRTRAKAERLVDSGAIWAPTAAEVAAQSDVVFSCVGYPRDVRDVFFGEQGILSEWSKTSASSDRVFVDMSTSSPELAIEIADAASNAGFDALDAPVSGGDADVVRRITPVLLCLGTNIRHAGAPGAGQRTKLANQILIAGAMVGVCESLLYAYKAGLDLENVLASVSTGAAGSWSLSNYGPRILTNDFNPGFYVEHFVKDMGLALEDAQKLNLSLPGLALVRELYVALMAQGGARKGVQALIQALARISNVDAFHD